VGVYYRKTKNSFKGKCELQFKAINQKPERDKLFKKVIGPSVGGESALYGSQKTKGKQIEYRKFLGGSAWEGSILFH